MRLADLGGLCCISCACCFGLLCLVLGCVCVVVMCLIVALVVELLACYGDARRLSIYCRFADRYSNYWDCFQFRAGFLVLRLV